MRTDEWERLRDFVADLLESEGAAVEPVEPDGLEVLAPRAGARRPGLAGVGAARLRRHAAQRRDPDRA